MKTRYQLIEFEKTEPNFTYAGIGSRQTPKEVCDFMTQLGILLKKMGYTPPLWWCRWRRYSICTKSKRKENLLCCSW